MEAQSHDKRLFDHDMNKAKANGDSIWCLGDMNSLILPKDLKRMTASHGMTRDAVVNKLVNQTFRRLEPYADNLDVLMMGNHETALLKYHSTDFILSLLALINSVKKRGAFADGLCHHGGYKTFILVQFKQRGVGIRNQSVSAKGLLFHGAGGGAPVTKGMIDGNRLKVANQFDFCAIGHKHTMIYDTDYYNYVDDYGNQRRKDRDYFVVGGYDGADVQQDPGALDEEGDPIGYMLSYSDEAHLGNQGQGSVRVVFTPHADGSGNWVTRNIMYERQPFAP